MKIIINPPDPPLILSFSLTSSLLSHPLLSPETPALTLSQEGGRKSLTDLGDSGDMGLVWVSG